MSEKNVPASAPAFSPFWPIFFIALTMIAFLGWQLSIGIRQYLGGVRFSEQQDVMAAQAARVEANFQALMLDVIELAERDANVMAVVRNYNIRFTPPENAATGTPAPEEPPTVTAPVEIAPADIAE